MTPTVTTKPQGFIQRLKTAGKVLATGKTPTDNPLAEEPKDRARARLVAELTQWCIDEREFWKPVFDRMREEMKFAAGRQWQQGYENATGCKDAYVGDVVQQMINRQTASLYAKNPEPEAALEERLSFELWDGDQSTIDAAQAIMAQAAPIIAQAQQVSQQRQKLIAQGADPATLPPEPPAPPANVTQAQDVLNDYQNGMAEKAMLQKLSRTGTLLIKQQWRSQSPDMLVSGKQAVSQIIVSRVAYIKAMYRRDMDTVPTQTANDMEFSDRIATLQAQLQTLQQDETEVDDPKNAEAKLLKASIEKQIEEMKAEVPPPVTGDEGVVHDWLGSTSVLVDRHCTCLREFIGARRIAHEMFMSVEDCEAKFKINLKDSGARYYLNAGGCYQRGEDQSFEDADGHVDQKRMKVCTWEIQDKTTGLCYTVIDGVKDFIKEPEANSPEVSRFWNIVPIVFNCQVVEENIPEEDVTIFPRSQIRLAMPMQIDINTAGEGLREHRVANRPTWTGVKSKFASTGGQNDLEKLARPRGAHEVLMMEGVMPGEKIADFIQPLPTAPIDPRMYDNAPSSQAMMLATGEQPSDIGAQRPDEKATGQNIAAQARATSVGSNIDDLDFAYSTLAQMDWEMLIQEMPVEVVKELVGRGATWPDLSRDDAARSITFKISAGSTGRPNEQADLNNFQVIAPQLGQLMTAAGKSLEPLIKEGVRRLGDKLDVDEFLKPAQIVMPPAPQPEPQKPPTIAITMPFQFLPPEIQSQVESAAGFKPASPASHLIEKVGHGDAVKAAHENTLHVQTGGNPPQPKKPNTP
jgi:hypothetical protein